MLTRTKTTHQNVFAGNWCNFGDFFFETSLGPNLRHKDFGRQRGVALHRLRSTTQLQRRIRRHAAVLDSKQLPARLVGLLRELLERRRVEHGIQQHQNDRRDRTRPDVAAGERGLFRKSPDGVRRGDVLRQHAVAKHQAQREPPGQAGRELVWKLGRPRVPGLVPQRSHEFAQTLVRVQREPGTAQREQQSLELLGRRAAFQRDQLEDRRLLVQQIEGDPGLALLTQSPIGRD